MQKAIILVCLVLYVTLTSSDCNKKTTPPAPANDTYQPTTAGSEWNYTTTGTAGTGPVNATFKITATSNDSTANGRTFRIFTNSAGGNEYYNKSGNDYYRISSFVGFSSSIEFLYLKDNLTAGGSWTESKSITFPGIPIAVPVNLSYSVVGNKFDTSFNGNAFKDVIRVRVRPSSSLATVDIDDITYLYAKNVGMILNKVRLKITLASIDVNTETKLGAYTIK
jgi:hypothetical protein